MPIKERETNEAEFDFDMCFSSCGHTMHHSCMLGVDGRRAFFFFFRDLLAIIVDQFVFCHLECSFFIIMFLCFFFIQICFILFFFFF
jgi:hypothetical protein